MVGLKHFDDVDVLDVSKPFRPEFGGCSRLPCVLSSVVLCNLHVARLAPDLSTKSKGVRSWRAALCGFGIILSVRQALHLLTPESFDGDSSMDTFVTSA